MSGPYDPRNPQQPPYGGQGHPQQPQNYPPQGQPYPPQGQPYPQHGQPYPPQGQQPYPQQGQPYPQQGQPYPPQGQPPMGQPHPGYGHPPYPQPPRPVKKGMPVWAWILIGFMGLVIVASIAIMAVSAYFVRKATDIASNPVAAIAKIAAATNPDIEVLDVDETSRRVTIKDRKSGKTVTIDADQLEGGRLEIETEDGKMVAGGPAAVKVPSWVPTISGLTPAGGMTTTAGGQEAGNVIYKSDQSFDDTSKAWEDTISSAGYTQTTSSTTTGGDGRVRQMIFSDESAGRQVSVMIIQNNDGVATTLTYSQRTENNQ